jgi:ElaB/YqjD/DUF883 family membrane-anchored ribosome-binding protein
MHSRQFGFIWRQFSYAWNNLKSRDLYESQTGRFPKVKENAMATSTERSQEARQRVHGSTAPESKEDAAASRDSASFASTVSGLATEKFGTIDELQRNADRKLSSVEAAIRRNPAQSALIAAGVGFVFGLALSR